MNGGIRVAHLLLVGSTRGKRTSTLLGIMLVFFNITECNDVRIHVLKVTAAHL